MVRGKLVGVLLAVLAAGAAAAAAPQLFARAAPGLWEISGVPGTKYPPVQCVADLATLAQFEHRYDACSRTVVSDSPTVTVIDYSCGAKGFGHSRLTMLTPRSLRIETQGISGGLPFNYVLQARRMGDCRAKTAVGRH